jgi:DNA mismatch repair protein MutS
MPPAKLTPAMEQYMHFKRQHPDAILFFRMGDFYEMFHDDAKIASKLLGLTLTSRNHGKTSGNVPLAGVPHHAMETYVAKLIQLGRKVAVCEQVEDPKKAKGVVKRDVVQVVSPGTALLDSMLDQQQNNFLASMFTDGSTAGLGIVDLSTGDFTLDEIPLAELAEELERLGPTELLLSEKAGGEWLDRIEINLPRVALSRLDDWHFEYHQAYELLTQQLEVRSLKGFDCDDMQTAVCAAGAAVAYLRDNQRGAVGHLNRLNRRRRGDLLLLDAVAQRNLELVRNAQDGGRQGTLLSVVDRTLTPMGARLMRQWLVSPLKEPKAINHRLDAVETLCQGMDLRDALRGDLSGVGDLERVMARICCQRANARDLVALVLSLKVVPPLRQRLAQSDSELLRGLAADKLPDTDKLVRLIGGAIADEPPATLTDGGLIRDGYDAELDRLRQISSGGKEWIAQMQTSERQRTGIASLKVGFNQVFGYYIEVSKANIDKVPEEYIRKQTLANAERYITPELKEYEDQVLGAEERCKDIENTLFLAVRQQCVDWTAQVQETARSLAQIDILASFADVALERGYVRPQVDGGSVIDIRGGRHPVVERQVQEGRFVPNDVQLDSDEAQVLLITGPNMAGKSTIIRQVGLIAVMAQMGSFVPADQAHIGAVDRVFTRVGASDNLARGESTFMVEMNEAANILNNVSRHSLILMDELGRGTSTFDGLSLAWAIVEYLHDNPAGLRPRTLFATHYHEMTELEQTLARVQNHNVMVREDGDHVVFLHRLAAGPCDRSYGINVAQMAGMPAGVVSRAKELLSRLEGEQIDTRRMQADPSPGNAALAAAADKPSLAADLAEGDVPAEIGSGDGNDKRTVPPVAPRANGRPQLELFAAADPDAPGERLVRELQSFDLSQITPLQALLKLNEWKEKLAKAR